MKNIHVLPTDKPSRLIKNNRGHALITDKFTQSDLDFIQAKFINIYITSDEEKKEERCWVINSMDKIESVPHSKWGKLIIMTTNQDLIKDGIQAIPDEFLEWFVKNPSCEMVEVENNWIGWTVHTYKIIIPKDEPKQETLEQAFEKWDDQHSKKGVGYDKFDVLQFGAKWQKEQNNRLYSEEQLRNALLGINLVNPAHLEMTINGYGEFPDSYKLTEKGISYIIEQFKKK